MDGCVPDSIRYVPGRRLVQVSDVVAPAATSVENDWTRGPWTGGVPGVVEVPAIGHVTLVWAPEWSGLGVEVAPVPSPPPN